jgi:DNA primase large subunit
MLLEYLDEFKDIDFLKALKVSKKYLVRRLKQIFEDKSSSIFTNITNEIMEFNDILRLVDIDIDEEVEKRLPNDDSRYNVKVRSNIELEVKKEIVINLLDFLLIILLSHTPYFNSFVRKYSELKKDKVIENIREKYNDYKIIEVY